MSDTPAAAPTFADLGLPAPLLKALNDVGYETPSPIQAQTIPPLLAGKDVLGRHKPAPARRRPLRCRCSRASI